MIVLGTLTYFYLIFILRTSGKRSLSKLSAFDFIVTIALGSILATSITDRSVTMVESFTALTLLPLLQFIVTKSSYHIRPLLKIIKSDPALLYYEGEYLEEHMRNERILPEEVRQAVRMSGKGSMNEVRAVVLETDGTMSVINTSDEGDDSDILPEA